MSKQNSSPLELKKHFPFFEKHPELIYLDTAATAHKPFVVIEAMSQFLSDGYAPVHRAAYSLSYLATEQYEQARLKIAAFIGSSSEELIFTKGTTEALNLIASSISGFIQQGDQILVLETEHHANLLPWQRLAEHAGASLVKIPVIDSGHIDMAAFKKLLGTRVKCVAIAHMSNVTGCIQPLKEIAELVHEVSAILIVDGAQGICHTRIDVKALNIDAYAFSSHKLYGPTGLGILHASTALQAKLDLYQVGGDVIESVSFEHTCYKKTRARFEAGTPMVTEVIGLSAAIDFLLSLDWDQVEAYEMFLSQRIQKALAHLPSIQLIGKSDTGLVSFYSEKVHSLDMATYLDSKHIAARSGHLCAQPALHRFHTKQAVRLSCGLYTSVDEVDKALRGIEEALLFFS